MTEISRVPLNGGGYDRSGSYWGIGPKLYSFVSDETGYGRHFRLGQRVMLHPATDLWMRGARFGTIAKAGRKYVHIKLDALSRPVRVAPDNIDWTAIA